jgi:hypothetical protein
MKNKGWKNINIYNDNLKATYLLAGAGLVFIVWILSLI